MRHITYILIWASLVMVYACSPAKGDRTGHEFMPDMVHSTGYDANLYDYYHFNRWGTKEDYKHYASPRLSVDGTVARGQISVAQAEDVHARLTAMAAFDGMNGAMAITPNGSVPYYYGDTEPERFRAAREITANPFPITANGLVHGKELYTIYCGICHGDKGDGLGYLVRDADPAKGIPAGVYPAAPASFLMDTFINASAGRIYHAVMRGKNVMGSYADKLSYQERWDVIHYIRALQAASKNLEYSPKANTFRPQEAAPWATVEATMKKEAVMAPDTARAHTSAQTGHGNTNEHH